MKCFKRILVMMLVFFLTMSGVCQAIFYEGTLNSESVYFVNTDTNLPIIEKNIDERRAPASLTKIMTAALACESVSDLVNTKVRVTQEVLDKVDPESSGVVLKAGEEISVLDLIHCVLICSSGCAANVLADYVGGGSIENFVDKMNAKAQELGCKDTHFVNPDGIYNSEHYSTAADMYKITQYARSINLFNDITSKCEYSCFGDERDPIITTNSTMDPKRGGIYYCPFVKGIKTGYTDEAGRCLISCAESKGVEYVGVVMGGPTKDSNGEATKYNMAMLDTKNIYTWLYENLHMMKLYAKDFPLAETNLNYVWGVSKLLLCPENDFSVLVPNDVKKEDIVLKCKTPESVSAPVEEGDILGSAEVFYNGQKLGEFNLVSPKTYAKNWFVVVLDGCRKIIFHPIFMILFFVALILFVLYLMAVIRNARRRKRRMKIRRFPGRPRRK